MNALFLSAVLLCATAVATAREYYVDVPMSGPADLKKYTEMGFDVGGVDVEKKTATLVMQEAALSRTRSLRVISKREVGRLDQAFKKYSDVEKALLDTEKRFPHLTKIESIGKSGEGREILAIQITAQFSLQKKEVVLFDAMHHAREVMTPEVALDIVDYLTRNFDTDLKVRNWLNKYEVWVIPMVNPDGNNKVWNAATMWRKNTKGGYGVDVNRNYPYAWNTCNGSSGNKNDDDYRGASAGSEPETQAITNFVKKIRPKMNISYHSFSEIVIYPFGCSPKKITAPDATRYLAVGKELARRLVRDSGSGSYAPGTSYQLLYDVDGGSIDWMYNEAKVMSFVVEVNSTTQGFQPSYAKWRDISVERQRAGWQYILDEMSGPGVAGYTPPQPSPYR